MAVAVDYWHGHGGSFWSGSGPEPFFPCHSIVGQAFSLSAHRLEAGATAVFSIRGNSAIGALTLWPGLSPPPYGARAAVPSTFSRSKILPAVTGINGSSVSAITLNASSKFA